MPLSPRHRAMLLEIGVRTWAPPTPGARAETPAAAGAAAPPPAAPPRAARPLPPTAGGGERSPAPAGPWQVQAPRLLYPGADPAQAPLALGAGWFIVTDILPEGEPLAADADRLLANMLAALQLHRHPRVALCGVGPAPAAGGGTSEPAAALAQQVAAFAPAVVLVMGRSAVRAALARSEPLGKLRGARWEIAGVPAVVTFDACFLLRNPGTKAAAWADLCLARALAGRGAAERPAGPVP